MELSKFLLNARETKTLTQKQLAEKLGIASAQLISNWERGLCAPPLKKLDKLTTILGLEFDPTFELVMKYKSEIARQKAAVRTSRPRKGALR